MKTRVLIPSILGICLIFTVVSQADDKHASKKPGDSRTSAPTKKVGGGIELFADGSVSVSEGDESEWDQIECRTDGTCVYKHRITGVERIRDSKVAKKPKPSIEEALRNATVEEKKSATNLTEEESKTLVNKEIASLSELRKLFAAAKKAGKDTLIVQVGNLENCAPCQAVNKAIQESAIAKDSRVGIYETSILTLEDQPLRDLYRSMKLPEEFSFPQVFVMGLNEKGDWISKVMRFERDQATVDGLKAGIDQVRASGAEQSVSRK